MSHSLPSPRRRAAGVAFDFAFAFITLIVTLAPAWPHTGLAATIDLQGHRFDPLVDEPVPPAGLAAPPARGGELGLAIVQFAGPITPSDRERLVTALGGDTSARATADRGARIIDYLPGFAYLVRTRAPLSTLSALDGVRWAGPYHPAFRLSNRIGTLDHLDPERVGAPCYRLRVETLVADGATKSVAASVDAAVRALGGRVAVAIARDDRRRLEVELPIGREIALARHPDVLWIEEVPDHRLLNDVTRWVVQSNTNDLTPIWDHGLHGEGRIAGLMDSGLDFGSCWFRDDGNPLPGPTHRKVIDYTEWGGSAYDGCDLGHGTHVGGTLAGDQSFVNPGNLGANGLAHAARLVVQDIGTDTFLACLLGLVNVPASLVPPLQAAYDLGARVHSNSWGSTDNTYDADARDVDLFMWEHPDFLVLFAAGNSGPGAGSVGSPGTAKSCVTVGATRQAPEQETLAGYSSRGPTTDGRLKPTVTAPGGETPDYITSADNHPDSVPTCQTVSSPFQGTSMATPAVAGLALLVQQYFAEGWYPTGAPTGANALVPSAALVKALLVNAGTDMAALDIPNMDEGWGRLVLDDGLYFAGDTRELRIEEHAGIATAETVTFDYAVESGEPFEVVLVWTDHPAALGAGTALVNDLDLTVSGPGGTYRGNVFAAGQSTPGGSHDRLNVEEVVRLSSPPAGDYAITVTGFNVPQGAPGQPFALVSTGAFASWPPSGTGIGDPAGDGGLAHGAGDGDGNGDGDGDGNDDGAPGTTRAAGLALHVARPNPFNPSVEIRYENTTAHDVSVRLEIHDTAGRRVRTLVDQVCAPGQHAVRWDGRDQSGVALGSGVYYARLLAGGSRLAEKLTLIR